MSEFLERETRWNLSDVDAIRTDRCGVFCDAEPTVSFIDEWGIEVHWCRECYERPCDHCGGEIEDRNKRKGMCQDRRDEISMWGGDEDRGVEKDPGDAQTKLMTDGGQSESAIERTPGTPRNRIECDECGDVIETQQDSKRTVRWGFWDAESQNYSGESYEEHYCPDCWREEFERDAAAHFEVHSAQELWEILDAADGRLVADLKPVFVGGRPWIRVRNGELEGMKATRRMVETDDKKIMQFGVERFEPDWEEFVQALGADEDLSEDDYPTIALLKPADETPFTEFRDLHADQATFPEVEHADN